MLESIHHITIPEDCANLRLDKALAMCLPNYTRSQLQVWITSGQIKVDGVTKSCKTKIKGGEHITLIASPTRETKWTGKPLPLSIVHEDTALLIINKPAGCVVHPAPGHADDTLVNALLYHEPSLGQLPRAGLIHRLDRDTTGLLIVAKTLNVYHTLVANLKARTIQREYLGIVHGLVTAGGTISAPIGRHPKHRLRMAVTANGKAATTTYRVLERYKAHTLLQITLKTGRTHQIRVHLSHHHYPIVGDPLYGGRPKLPFDASHELILALQTFKRQVLHAFRLSFLHPETHEMVSWEIPCPNDIQQLIHHLKKDKAACTVYTQNG